MTKTILVSLAVLTLASSAALAATHKKTHHHHHAVKSSAAAPASPMGGSWTGGVSKADHDMYVKNQHDAGLKR